MASHFPIASLLVAFLFVFPLHLLAASTRTWDEAYHLATALVSQMSTKEKVALTTGIGEFVGSCGGNTAATSVFPSLCLNDGPLGIRGSSLASAFVAGINAAASFDRELIYQRGADIGHEFRSKGIHIWLGPAMDIMRAPRAGRNWESFGEDPFLAGVCAYETITGAQEQGVIATAKHFIGNNQETFRALENSKIDERTLQEIYYWPFREAIDAGVGAVMCSYNKLNGTYACENKELLTRDLKERMSFRGFVMSDWHATHSTTQAAAAGLDMTMPGKDGYFGAHLEKAVADGSLPESKLNEAASRIVASWYKMGQDTDFPPLNVDTNHPALDPALDVQGDHKKGIRQIGAASVVLLRNTDSILPIKPEKLSDKRIIVAGTDAGNGLLGPNPPCLVHSCNTGTVATGGGSGSASFPYLVTPLYGIRERAKKDGIQVDATLNDLTLISDILTLPITALRQNDTCIVFGSAFSMEAFDRVMVTLDGDSIFVIRAVAATCSNTIVVIHSVGPVDMSWANHPNIKAILWAGLPGQESGNSLADVLFGDVNPSGRLPYTLAKKFGDYPADVHLLKTQITYDERLLVGYKWFDAQDIEPFYEFGYGLSYTEFTYKHLMLNTQPQNVQVAATATVCNTGLVDGAEIVQAYVSFPKEAKEPPKLLRGFEKVFLPTEVCKEVRFLLGSKELSIWDTAQGRWVVPKGEYTLLVGASSRDIRLTASFDL
ncbi:glycoside hydrolase superfamily [Dichotomocladium elegans]|nr:glycoside hydrolase superfamily [Dichotomocladium elegans]